MQRDLTWKYLVSRTHYYGEEQGAFVGPRRVIPQVRGQVRPGRVHQSGGSSRVEITWNEMGQP